jgi:hypothetical protein
MGAKGPVHVETLIAKNTVEETMKALDEQSRQRIHHADDTHYGKRSGGRVQKEKEDATISKTHSLLKGLRLITDYHHFATSKINSKTSTNGNTDNKSTTPEDAARLWREGMHKRKRQEGDGGDSPSAAALAAQSKMVRFAL